MVHVLATRKVVGNATAKTERTLILSPHKIASEGLTEAASRPLHESASKRLLGFASRWRSGSVGTLSVSIQVQLWSPMSSRLLIRRRKKEHKIDYHIVRIKNELAYVARRLLRLRLSFLQQKKSHHWNDDRDKSARSMQITPRTFIHENLLPNDGDANGFEISAVHLTLNLIWL